MMTANEAREIAMARKVSVESATMQKVCAFIEDTVCPSIVNCINKDYPSCCIKLGDMVYHRYLLADKLRELGYVVELATKYIMVWW